MNKTIIGTILITALVTFIATAVLANGNVQGQNAQYWYNVNQNTQTYQQADFKAITCIRGLGYTNLPNLNSYYTNLDSIGSTDTAGNYYSKYQVDSCLYGL